MSEVDTTSLEVSRTQVISGLEELSLISGTVAPGPNLPARRHRRHPPPHRRRSPIIRRVSPTLSGGRTHIPHIPARARPTATETRLLLYPGGGQTHHLWDRAVCLHWV